MNDIQNALNIIKGYGGLEGIIGQENSINNQIEEEISWNNYAENVVKKYSDYKNKSFFKRLFYYATNTKEVKSIKQEYENVVLRTNASTKKLGKFRSNFSQVNKDIIFLNETIRSFGPYLNNETYNLINNKAKQIKQVRDKIGLYLSVMEYRISLLYSKQYFEPEPINFEKEKFDSVYVA